MPVRTPPLNCSSMTLGLFRTKLAGIVAPGVMQTHGLLATLVPTTRRTLSQPRTSTTPDVREIRTTAARAEAPVRRTIWTPLTEPLVFPLTTTLRPGTRRRERSVVASMSMLQRSKRLFTRGHESKVAGRRSPQNAAIPPRLGRPDPPHRREYTPRGSARVLCSEISLGV